jgi:hypothetical protein
MKFAQTDYSNKETILKFVDHYFAIPVQVEDADVAANSDGKNILPAGTPVGGIGGSVLADESLLVEKKNTQGAATGTAHAGVDAEGVLLEDVDCSHGDAPGTMLIHGFVDTSKLPEAIVDDALGALPAMIAFVE